MSKRKGNAGSEMERIKRLCDRTWDAAIEFAAQMAEKEKLTMFASRLRNEKNKEKPR